MAMFPFLILLTCCEFVRKKAKRGIPAAEGRKNEADFLSNRSSLLFCVLVLLEFGNCCCSTMKRTTVSWAELHREILHLILERLSIIDSLRFGAVGSSWRSVLQEHISSSAYCSNPQAPLLMLPCEHVYDEEDYDDISGRCFFSPQENRVYKMKNKSDEFHYGKCIGSSHGWLVLVDERNRAHPFLLNPLSYARIQLPSFPHTQTRNWYSSVEQILIAKVILSADPVRSKNNFKVIEIYGIESKLAFCNIGDCTWTDLGHRPYFDIIYCNNQLCALTGGCSVEAWDLHSSHPVRKLHVQPSILSKTLEFGRLHRDLFSSKLYLVESEGDLFLVVRFIGEFVDKDGKPISEGELLTDEYSHPQICPYKTLVFHVYKLDFNMKTWVEVESLGDRALFLGGNHSMSLSTCHLPEVRENSIYFTDDYWERMDEDYLYGGQDLGVYNLEDRSVHPIYDFAWQRIQPPPFWVTPNPW